MNAKAYKHAEKVGPGGVHCPCCINGKLSDHKRRNNRKFRRKAKQTISEEVR